MSLAPINQSPAGHVLHKQAPCHTIHISYVVCLLLMSPIQGACAFACPHICPRAVVAVCYGNNKQSRLLACTENLVVLLHTCVARYVQCVSCMVPAVEEMWRACCRQRSVGVLVGCAVCVHVNAHASWPLRACSCALPLTYFQVLEATVGCASCWLLAQPASELHLSIGTRTTALIPISTHACVLAARTPRHTRARLVRAGC